jgi:hypothetical protein
MNDEQPEYLAYLLRMWRVQDNSGFQWRVSLERPRNGQRIAFVTLEEAFNFLFEQTGEKRPEETKRGDEPARKGS